MLTATMLVCLIVVDDLGSNLRYAAPTPNLDRLAAQGVDFKNVWSAPSCSPYRAQLMTGLYPHRDANRVGQVIQPKHVNNWRLSPSADLLPAEIEGWTSMYGKWHLSDLDSIPSHPHDCGWGEWWGTNYNLGGDGTYFGGPCYDNGTPDTWSGYITEVTAAHAVGSLQNQDQFVYIPLHGIHKPLEPPPPYLHSQGDLTNATDWELAIAMTEATDAVVGRIASEALRQGYIVIVTTDNGTSGIIGGAKGSFEERGLNTWLHIVGEGIEPGVDEALVCPTDLYTTITHMTNGTPTLTEDAYSLYGNLWPSGDYLPSERAYAFSCKFKPNGAVPPTEFFSAIRDGRWKLMLTDDAPSAFYDLESDPGESTNLLRLPMTDEQHEALRRLDDAHGEVME